MIRYYTSLAFMVVYFVYIFSRQTYIAPHVPTGVSLNLSPGQILPRQFLVPFIQPAVSSTPPGSYAPPFPAGPLLSHPNEPQYTTTIPDDTDSEIRNDLSTIQGITQHGGDTSSNSIGMAMLELTDNAPVLSPHAFLSLPHEEDFDPFDQHRRVPSPLLSARPELFRGQANQSPQDTSSTGTSSNKLDVIRPVGHLRNKSDPPMYNKHIDDGRQPLNEIHLREQRQLQSFSQGSQNPLTSQDSEVLAGTGPQQHSNKSDNGLPSNDWRNVSLIPPDRNSPPPPAVSRGQRIEVAQGHGNEPDVQSTRYSASIYSSSQFPSGRRPPHYLPKRLVMPSPLNTGPPPNAAASLHDSPMAPMQYHGNSRAQDISVFGFGGRKLRKKASMILSFVPPIIELRRNDDKGMAQSKTESKLKRLSKGRR